LDALYGQQEVIEDIIGDALKVENFVENIRYLHVQVQEALKKS
jgi:hypothetical protein